MAKSDAPVPSSSRGLNVHLRGHVLLFDKRPAPVYDTSAGARLLLTVFVMETLRLAIVSWLHPALPLLILVLLLLLCALLLVRFAVGVRLSQLGLYPWDEWHPVEKSYFVQLLVIANVVFPLVFAARR